MEPETEQPPAGGSTRRAGWLWVVCAVIAVLGVLAAAGRVPGATPETPVIDAWGGFDGEEIRGTRGPDTLRGTDRGDVIFAFGGEDSTYAGPGDDLIDPGNGGDEVFAGDGDDRIRSFDAQQDTIWCGPGNDIVFADPDDAAHDCEEIVGAADFSYPLTPVPPSDVAPRLDGEPAAPVTGTVELEDQAWHCQGPVDLDLVKVRVGPAIQGVDAVYLGPYCTGRIGRIEVDTWSGDGIKVQNTGVVAHDLVIESGAVRCHGRTPGYHQDGIQVMGGERLRFREVTVRCGGPGVNAALFIALGGTDERGPIDVVFERGALGPGAAQTVLLSDSLRSGIRTSTICAGRYASIRVQTGAREPVERGNELVGETHRACSGG